MRLQIFVNWLALMLIWLEAGIGSDTRIGDNDFLYPGIGYGGSCFPKDVQALVKSGNDAGYTFEILNSVVQINQRQKTIMFPKIKNYFKGI